MWQGFTRLTFRASCLRLGNFRTLSLRVVEKSLNWPTFCAALHYGPLETAPIEGFGSPRAATALLLTVEFVLVSTVVVFPWVRNSSEPPPHLLVHVSSSANEDSSSQSSSLQSGSTSHRQSPHSHRLNCPLPKRFAQTHSLSVTQLPSLSFTSAVQRVSLPTPATA